MAGIKFDITGDNRNVLDAFKGVQNGVRQTQQVVEKSGGSVEKLFGRIKDSALKGIKEIASGVAGLTALIQSGSFLKELHSQVGEFGKAMLEVSTLSEDVANNLEMYKQKVVDICREIAIAPEEAAKALYQIESAGHHGADGLNVLQESAKGAIGGVTETAVAADAITTILNSYKMSAEEAAHVNDLLFTTVRLGKTTYGELGSVMAQVTPIAAAYGVKIEDVLAAIASLTKQGTKTGVAVRQVRDAITAATNSLGDGAFKTRSFIEAMEEVAEKSKGSESALKSDLSKLSAMNAVLALTGKNAAAAKADIDEIQNSAGAADAAYQKMAVAAGSSAQRLRNNIFNLLMPVSNYVRSIGKDISESLNDAFDTGTAQEAIVVLGDFIVTYGIYRGLLASTAAIRKTATTANYSAEIAELNALLPLKQAEAQTDLEIAVAEGRLAPEKAEMIAALRAEAAAYVQELQAKAASAQGAMVEAQATQANIGLRLEEAQMAVAAAEAKYAAAMKSGNAVAIETAELELNIAASTENSVASEYQAAVKASEAAATQAATTAKIAESAANTLDATTTGAGTVATGLLTKAKMQLAKAIDAVNASFLASPLFWIIAAIGAAAYATYKLVTAESAHESAIRQSNEAWEEFNKNLDERKNKINQLVRTIQDQNATEFQQLEAYNELKSLAPDITDKYAQQELAVLSLDEANKSLNKSLENSKFEQAKKDVEMYEESIERLKKQMDDDAKTTGGRNALFNLGQMDNLEEKLAQAREVYNDLISIKKEAEEKAAEEAIPIEVRLEEARSNAAVMERIFKFYDEAKTLTENWQDANDQINFYSSETSLDRFIAKAEADLADLRKQIEKNPMDQKLRLEEEEKQKVLDGILQMKADWLSSGFLNIPLQFTPDWNSAKQAAEAARARAEELGNRVYGSGTETSNLQKDFNDSKEKYEAAKRHVAEIEANREAWTKEEYIAAKSRLSTAEDLYKSLGGETKDKTKTKSKATDDATRKLREQKRYEELVKKQKLEQERSVVDLAFSTTQAEIDTMKDGSEKTLRQMELDFRKREEEINRGYEDLKQSKIDKARQLWEANPANKGKVFDESTVNASYTPEEQRNYRSQLAANRAEYQRHLEEQHREEQQYLYDYLKEWGSIQQQKDAIAKEYDQKIADEGNAIQREALRRQKEQALSELDFKELQQSIDWERVFGDLDRYSTSALRTLKENLRTALDAKDITVENAKVLAEKINEVDDRIISRSDAWASFLPILRERKRLTEEAVTAEQEYQRALSKNVEAQGKVMKLQQQATGILRANGKEDSDVSTEGLKRLLSTLDPASDAFTELTKIVKELEAADKALVGAISEEEKARRKQASIDGQLKNFNSIGKAFENGKNAAGGDIQYGLQQLQELPELIDAIGLHDTEFGQGVNEFVSGTSNFASAIQKYQNGDFVGAATDAIKGIQDYGHLIERVGGFSFSGSNADEVRAENNRLIAANENLTKSIDSLRGVIDKKYGRDAAEAAEKAIQQQQEKNENILKEFANEMGYHSAHHSNSYYYDIGQENADKLNEFLKGNGIDKSVRAGVWEDLMNLTPEEMKLVSEQLGDVWNAIISQGKYDRPYEILDEYIEQAGKISEINDQLVQRMTGSSADSVFDDFLSSLYDLANDSEEVFDEVADNWQKMVNKMVIDNLVGSQFQDKIKKWAEEVAKKTEAMSNGELSKSQYLADLDELQKQREGYLKEAQELMETYKSAGIIKATGNDANADKSASALGLDKISYEQADQIQGQLTAIQIAQGQGNATAELILLNIQTMHDMLQPGVSELRSLAITRNEYLLDIKKSSREMLETFSEKIDNVERAIKELQ